MVDKTPRSADTREKSSARKPWAPPSSLDAPPAPEGYAHRWVRVESGGADDRKNFSARLREGFEPVRAEEFPDFHMPTIQDGKHAGVIGVGGLILCRIPVEIVAERQAYYGRMAREQMQAVDNDLMRENNPVMPIHKPDRRSNVTFGGSGRES
jgi:hypothetical protein